MNIKKKLSSSDLFLLRKNIYIHRRFEYKINSLYFLVRRVRCETLGRLDEIKTENEAKRKVQIISWQDPSTAQNNNKSNFLKKITEKCFISFFN